MTLSLLETCDLCHDYQPLRKIYFDGKRFYCRKCRTEAEKKPETNPLHPKSEDVGTGR